VLFAVVSAPPLSREPRRNAASIFNTPSKPVGPEGARQLYVLATRRA
jgi:hypothetical protein